MNVKAELKTEQCQEFCPSSVKHGRLQPQRVALSRRKHPKTFREGARKQNKHSAFRRPLWGSAARKKCRQMEEERQTPIEKPYSSVGSHRFEVSCCSDIYTSVGGTPELSSQPESMYIYAESIKGCDTSCSSVSQDWGLFCLYKEVKKTCGILQDPRSETAKIGSSIEALLGSDSSCDGESVRGYCDSDSSCVNADWERSFDSDDDSCNLVYSFAEAQWGSASSCSGSAASGYITDYDLESSFSTTEQYSSSAFGSRFEAGHHDLSAGRFDAGHCDSAVNQFEARDCDAAIAHFEGGYHDLPVSHFKSGHLNLPVGHFEAGHWGLPIGHFEAGHYDSRVSHFLPCGVSLGGHFEPGYFESTVDRFEARHCDSPVSHFRACGASLGGRFEAGHHNSPVRHFEAGCRDLPVGHFDAGYFDSTVDRPEAKHCDSPDTHFDEASCDLYDAFPESSDAVSSSNKAHHSFLNLKDYSELTWRKLRGVVTHPDRDCVAPFFHEMMKETAHDRNQEGVKINKGFLFHPQRFLQAKNSEYREGQEYSVLRHVQNGSYGDVFSVRDKQTGFTCAAKRIPLSSFSWKEVETWSRLDSPRVLQLYGAVQEGLNVILFMDLKTGSLAQFLKAIGRFPEELALYYHCQVLQALEHLHSRKVIHLDVKVDNVLLSKDKRECFLCDFGLSEMLDWTGYSTKTFRGNGLRGTESHMSPEVARGDPRSDKADVWSSCCMLLHMLSGHQPWTRYYTHPLCLKIVSEPAPLWEIPSGCDPLTCDVIRGGLVKEPGERDSARELLEKSKRALRTVGGPLDRIKSATQTLPQPQICPPMPSPSVFTQPPMAPPPVSNSTSPPQDELSPPRIQWVSGWRERAAEEDGTDSEDAYEDSYGGMDRTERWMERYWGLRNEYTFTEDENITEELKYSSEGRQRERAAGEKRTEEEGESDEEMESDLGSLRELGSEDEWEPFHRMQILYGSKRQPGGDEGSETEEERAPSIMTSLNHVNMYKRNSRLTLTCHRSVCTSEAELTDKGSDWSDDLSSGVFSDSNLADNRSFNVDWSVSTNQPPSCSFEGLGVDIWVEDVSGDTFRIRERLRVKLSHVAIGISGQVSMRVFSLATLDGKLVSPDTEVLESRMWLLCVPAPDNSTNWTWRIRDGKMETQDTAGLQSDTCSTLTA
ncbi:mitogen-activated protein kinase kinase kinase 14 isoform X4 [Neoarius graeffei]|uniref:mitogen-activated protein kinase kinase kinase 14 isoform X4 n=1 Tax=Neoarius graeffei TaxID=443677 RepID=UPI00298C6994|nr:mitogen-activated protein kinase kinase kinase 14 isoform X4 [Neoarius graeffei]